MALPAVEIPRRPSIALFAILGIVLVIGSYLFVALLAAGCVYLPCIIFSRAQSEHGWDVLILLFGIVIAATMLWSLIPRREEFTAPGLLLDRSSHPRLFAEIDSIASALNEPVPRDVYLIGEANAFVADRGGMMGLGSRRIMGLGLPLLSTMTVSQIRAVLAHEFAHYYGGDTSVGPWVYRTKASFVRVFENVGSVGELARVAVLGVMYVVVTSLLKWYFVGFLRISNFVSRRQEYRADELACLLAGRHNLIDGLQALHRAAAVWPTYWKQEVRPVLSMGSLVALGDGLTRFMAEPHISEAIGKSLETRLREEKTKPYDTHPPLRDRIAAAQKLPEGSALQDSQPATCLLENLRNAEILFVENRVDDVRPGSLNYVLWDEVALRVTIPGWQQFVSEYSEPLRGVTAQSLPDQVPNLREIGSRIRDPKGMLLSPDQRTARAGGLFAAALALAMIRSGWNLQVAPGVFRMSSGDHEFNPFLAVNELMTNKLSREAWTARCQDLGLSQLVLLPSSPSEHKPEPSPQAGLLG
jgi:Zn-dependent protease with chaperone function